jgi:hypothetical protein
MSTLLLKQFPWFVKHNGLGNKLSLFKKIIIKIIYQINYREEKNKQSGKLLNLDF